MLACDYRIAADGDFRVGLNETMIGMTMHHFGLELARNRLPNSFFNRCVFNAEIFSPSDAVRAGFYDLVVPEKDLEKSVVVAVKNFENLNMSAFKGSKLKGRFSLLKLLDECIEKGLFLEGATVSTLNYDKSNIKLGDLTADELEEIRRSVWKKAFAKKMEQQKKDSDKIKAKYNYTSVQDFQFNGFKIRPPSREKGKETKKPEAQYLSTY